MRPLRVDLVQIRHLSAGPLVARRACGFDEVARRVVDGAKDGLRLDLRVGRGRGIEGGLALGDDVGADAQRGNDDGRGPDEGERPLGVTRACRQKPAHEGRKPPGDDAQQGKKPTQDGGDDASEPAQQGPRDGDSPTLPGPAGVAAPRPASADGRVGDGRAARQPRGGCGLRGVGAPDHAARGRLAGPARPSCRALFFAGEELVVGAHPMPPLGRCGRLVV